MKCFVFIIVALHTSFDVAAQTELRQVTGEYLQSQERGNIHGSQTLEEAYRLIEYQSLFYSKTHVSLKYNNHLLFPLDYTYETISTLQDQPFYFTGHSKYIAFYNIETNGIDRVIELDSILSTATVPQIFSNNKGVSIAVSKDEQYLFFGTATNTYQYNLADGSYKEIRPHPSKIFCLDPVNEILQGTTLIFQLRKTYNGYDFYEGNEFIEYDYIKKTTQVLR
ncbi:MAG: hypothetical protein ABJH04_07625 [Cyclobacteriaceae bacterium]